MTHERFRELLNREVEAQNFEVTDLLCAIAYSARRGWPVDEELEALERSLDLYDTRPWEEMEVELPEGW